MTKYWVVRAEKDIQDIVERDGFIGTGFELAWLLRQ